jgi:hypothetical protein
MIFLDGKLLLKILYLSITDESSNVGYGSLSIWTHNLKGIEWIEQWTPTGQKTTKPESVVRYGSGVQWSEINREAYMRNKIVAGGTTGVSKAFNYLLVYN